MLGDYLLFSVCVPVFTHKVECVCVNNSFFFSHHVDPRNPTQVTRLDGKEMAGWVKVLIVNARGPAFKPQRPYKALSWLCMP